MHNRQGHECHATACRRLRARSPEPVDHPPWGCRTGAADSQSPRSVDALGWSLGLPRFDGHACPVNRAKITSDGKRPRILLGPYATERECTDALLDALGKIRSGRHADARRTKFGEYLDRRLRWWGSEADIKPSTLASYREAI